MGELCLGKVDSGLFKELLVRIPWKEITQRRVARQYNSFVKYLYEELAINHSVMQEDQA